MHKPGAPSIGGWLFILYMTIVVGGLIAAMASDDSPAGFTSSFAAALVLSFIVWGVGPSPSDHMGEAIRTRQRPAHDRRAWSVPSVVGLLAPSTTSILVRFSLPSR